MNRPTSPPLHDAAADGNDAARLGDLSPRQWRAGIAAWLGWLFDGLDMHLYTVVATPFVGLLLANQGLDTSLDNVRVHAGWIQAAFLFGWAIGGGFFGRIGDRIGRSRALVLTILTYAAFTGLSYTATAWWHLLIFRFLAALGIGGEWAVGAALLAETWPTRWRTWLAATLQTGVNLGVMLATVACWALAGFEHRYVFLVGVLPALLVLWIRRAVPEPESWHAARAAAGDAPPGLADLFRGDVRRITVLSLIVCGSSLTAHWAFMFWHVQHLRGLVDAAGGGSAEQTRYASQAMFVVNLAAILGNFLAAWVARHWRYRVTIAGSCLCYFGILLAAYSDSRSANQLLWIWFPLIGLCQGMFGLFTMYLPPLFPTLLRTTGAGFCYNFGRIAAAGGTALFGMQSAVGTMSQSMQIAATLFIPAAAAMCFMPEPADGSSPAPME